MAWAALEVGFSVIAQGFGGLFLLGLLGVSLVAYRYRLQALPWPTAVATGALAAFVAWAFASITWADVPADAWQGANRALIYLCVFALFAIRTWTARGAMIVLGAWAFGCAAIGVIALANAAGAVEPILAFVAGRFAEPTGYHNASVALFTAALFPALLIASRREVPIVLRGVMLATAQTLLALSLVPQSRGWLIALPVAAMVALAIAPGRVRLAITALPLAAIAVITADPLLDVFSAVAEGRGLTVPLDKAVETILLGAAGALACGVALGLADRLLARYPSVARAGGIAGGAALAGALVAGAVAALVAIGNPVSWADERWDDLKSGEPEQGFTSSRLNGTLGTNRYDFWRVAIDSGLEEPLIGSGMENFAVDYVRERESKEEPLHPHSLPVKIVSQTGVVGVGLFLVFVVSASAGVLRARMAGSPLSRAAAAAAFLSFSYWAIHSSGDWFWAFAGVSAPAFAWLGLAGSVGMAQPSDEEEPAENELDRWPDEDEPAEDELADEVGAHRRSRIWAIFAAGAGAAFTLFAATSLVLPALAERDVEAAASGWGADPEAAFERLDRAMNLNFLSARPALVEGAIASRLGDRERMREAFESALEREPESWYARLELGALFALEGRQRKALGVLEEAQTRNPRDPILELTLEQTKAGDPLELSRIDAAFIQQVCDRLGATDATEICASDGG